MRGERPARPATTCVPGGRSRGSGRRWPVLLAAVLLAALLTACSTGRDEPTDHRARLVADADAAAAPRLDWAPCAEAGLAGYQCATAAVPIDYARPDGPTLDLAVLRQPATDPARRIGTLVTAAGGPGGSGLDAAASSGFPAELAARFDIVTFDQRGIGRSSGVRCFPGPAEQDAHWWEVPVPPVTPDEEAALARLGAELAAGCAAHTGELLAHLTTVDAARDIDLLRRALGEERISYLGGSYASYLGQVYGALFGERVRAMQLGALIEPDGYTTDPFGTIRDTALGTEEVRREFHRYCAAASPARCAAAWPGDTAREVAARDDALLARLRTGPLPVGDARFGIAEILPAHATLLYDVPDGWPALAELLRQLELGERGDPAVVREILAAGGFSFGFLGAFTAITCADTVFPGEAAEWERRQREVAEAAPVYGTFWLALRRPCGAWPAPESGYPQRFTGPWTLRGETPALLLSNRYDPVTPIGFARRAATELGAARLVEVDGHGHSPVGACARQLRDAYLIELRLPDPGTVCTPEQRPFGV